MTKWENGQVGVWTSGQVSEMGSEPVGEWAITIGDLPSAFTKSMFLGFKEVGK